MSRRSPWAALLAVHLIALAALVAWLALQSRPVQMHDLQLADGEKLKCVSYAPYHFPGQTPFDKDLRITREQIAADLAALSRITRCVRLYSVDQGLDQVPSVAREIGLKVLLGAWIGYDRKKNAAELDHAIAIANEYPDVVRALIVGNEVLLRRERSEDEMRALIRDAKSKSQVPVTYADVWEFWMRHDSLAREVDFVTVHILPFWEDEPVDIQHALQHVAAIHEEVQTHFGKAILIGETGWPSEGRQREVSRPSPANQARYIREFVHQAHDRGWDYNLIEAIDQPWKRRLEGTVGGYWGMLDADLKPKFPLAGPVADRTSMQLPLLGAALGAALAAAVALARRGAGGRLRVAACVSIGAVGGMLAVLNWEHGRVAYRDELEWILLGGLTALAATLAALVSAWDGVMLPGARSAWRDLRHGWAPTPARLLALARGTLVFAAAVAALLLFVDARYRDFPTLLYLTPALIFGTLAALGRGAARAERICAAIIVLCGIGRWLPEPANPQAIAWLATTLALGLPLMLARGEHQQGE
ncbi:putative glucan 1,3-beta-glucosidase [Azoarcus olearius]|uniref:glycoside hydrolase family 17 protein n=1 Tax=Azoarcus sp. (strain BH72) TaxID=418699 RepID=UPI0008060CD4|nr:beta-1,6-glucan synthase [Azoarcus olearius]ANQ84452.1 putative glucan 1,3-beta-glucosidase [Azoarcus olearius]